MGMIIGHSTTENPFRLLPDLSGHRRSPLDEKVKRLRDPEIRSQILSEEPNDPRAPLAMLAREFRRRYPQLRRLRGESSSAPGSNRVSPNS